MNIKNRITRRSFISVAAAGAGAALLPGVNRVAPAQAAPGRGESGAFKAHPFPIKDLRLGDGPCKEAMEANRRYLHFLPPDRMLHTFRLTAGLNSSAEPVGGWEKPDCELRGHFAGGHILSALALTYASTGDDELKKKGDEMVAALAKCQARLPGGYLGAYPTELYDRLRDRKQVWAPFYTYHKIMAGHLDMYRHCGNEQALAVAEGMARWAGKWTQALSEDHMQHVLEVEHGGMLEVLSELFALTGKQEYLDTARRFYHRKVFEPLEQWRDELKGLHANTNIPKMTGAARFYELTGDQRYHDIAHYFWHEVTGQRTYCNGGNSIGEHWTSDPGKLAACLSSTTCECCCAYNMLKLTRHLYKWTADPLYFDYYERTLFNHRLGTINLEDGSMMYFVPLASGYWKFYNSPFNSFWCCTGTGVEEYSKLADSIYFHDEDGLIINLFIASDLNWLERGIRLRQTTSFPEQEGAAFEFTSSKPVNMAVKIRIPHWATRAVEVKVNGQPQTVDAKPSSYLALRRAWHNGDRVEINFQMPLHSWPMPDDPSVEAMMYGPIVLAGRLGTQGLTKEMMYGQDDPAMRGEPIAAPEITADGKKPGDWVERVSGQPLTFQTVGQPRNLTLVPFYRLFGERYAIYWKLKQG